jgi:diguanylate cyclase (GGDEF)-like protein
LSNELILCVDDDGGVLSSLRSLLCKELKHGQTIEIAESGEEAIEIINEIEARGESIAVIIADYIMPGMKGDELLVKVHQRMPNTLTIMLTGQSSLLGVKRAINEANLFRFIEKPWHNEDLALTLQAALKVYDLNIELQRHVAELSRMNTELEATVAQRTAELIEKNKQLEVLSITDRLTGLHNRLFLDRVLEREFAAASRNGRAFSLMLLDIDKFKHVNDTFGHHFGDEVLISLAQILKSKVRISDEVGRWGGEEFLIVCPNTELYDATMVAENLRSHIEQYQFSHVGVCTASFGVATYKLGDTIAALEARADKALYAAKGNGRNQVVTEKSENK